MRIDSIGIGWFVRLIKLWLVADAIIIFRQIASNFLAVGWLVCCSCHADIFEYFICRLSSWLAPLHCTVNTNLMVITSWKKYLRCPFWDGQNTFQIDTLWLAVSADVIKYERSSPQNWPFTSKFSTYFMDISFDGSRLQDGFECLIVENDSLSEVIFKNHFPHTSNTRLCNRLGPTIEKGKKWIPITLYVCKLSTTQDKSASRPMATVKFWSGSPNLGKSVPREIKIEKSEK